MDTFQRQRSTIYTIDIIFLDDRMEIIRMEPISTIPTDAQLSQTSSQIKPLQITNIEEGKLLCK